MYQVANLVKKEPYDFVIDSDCYTYLIRLPEVSNSRFVGYHEVETYKLNRGEVLVDLDENGKLIDSIGTYDYGV